MPDPIVRALSRVLLNIIVVAATIVMPAVLVGTYLFVASKYKSIERRLLIGAAIVLGNVLVFGGFVLFLWLGGDRFPALEVRNQTSHAVVVNIGSDNTRIEPGARARLYGDYSVHQLTVVTDTTPPMAVDLNLHDGISGPDDVVILTDAEAPQ